GFHLVHSPVVARYKQTKLHRIQIELFDIFSKGTATITGCYHVTSGYISEKIQVMGQVLGDKRKYRQTRSYHSLWNIKNFGICFRLYNFSDFLSGQSLRSTTSTISGPSSSTSITFAAKSA